MNRRRRCILFLLALLWNASGCDDTHVAGHLPNPELVRWNNKATVVLEGTKSTLSVECELALTPTERAKGLMYRKEPLGSGQGMLFIMDTVENHSFWMKNTFIPLDMVFIAESGQVVGVVHDAAPLTRASRACGKASRYVLELDAGEARLHGIGAGTQAQLSLPD